MGFVALEDEEVVSCGRADTLVVSRFINPTAKANETPTTLKISAVCKGDFFIIYLLFILLYIYQIIIMCNH
jgi:hypothetical protein